jgi:acyl carrier protein
VKVRGNRIELGEIEVLLLKLDMVADAVVIVREDTPGDQRLVAYLILIQGVEIEAASLNSEIKVYLKQQLPLFMVPAYIEWMDAFPLLPNDKVNRRGFPRPSRTQKHKNTIVRKPETEMEIIMADIWEELLNIDDIETDDMFFDLGGHSLLTLAMVDRFAKQTNIRISPASLINQTLRQLAASAEASAIASEKDFAEGV